MKWLSIALLAVLVFAFSPAKPADAAVSFGFSAGFHNELSPYGAWVNYSNYGNCWRPYGTGYRPYVNGYWGYSNYGPTWSGNEAWAPYTYNYGNWIYTAQFGWIWVPGNDWHANQVDWAYGDGYIGWRPQSPAGYYYPGGNDFNLWVAIDSNHFGYHNYAPYAYRSDFVRGLWDRRVFRQRYDRIDRVQLERVTRRPVQFVNLRERDVRIGNRNTRMFVTPDQETRIQKHVEQVRRNENVRDERFNEQNRNDRNVMHQKFDDIRNKSNHDFSRERDRQFTNRDVERRQNNVKVERHENNQKVESVRRDEVRRSYNEPSRHNEVVREEKRNDFNKHESINRERNAQQERPSFKQSHEQRSPVVERKEVSRSEKHNDVRVEKSRTEKKQHDNKPPDRH